MMTSIWVVLFVALTGSHCGYGLPVRPTPQDYPHDGRPVLEGWGAEGGMYAAIPALALVITAIVLIFGCTWCYRHKDCKLFTASAQHLHTARVLPPDSGFSEPANNNISEDNNNGPISLREMQNIANNNAAAYIISENEERNRISRESVVEFEPLPTAFIGVDPLEHCADWFGGEDFPRNNLQYLREIGRGWFGRVVEGEIEEAGANTTVAVQILNQNASLEDKARFLDEAKMFRDVSHPHILAFVGKCLQEDPWILIFELCTMDLQQYLIENRPKMAILNENGVPLRIMCDVTSALAYLHSRGYTYGQLWCGSVLVRGTGAAARAVLGRYAAAEPPHDCRAPELQRRGALYTPNSEIWSLGTLIWEVCSWGSEPTGRPSPPPDLPCPYKSHLYQVMQLCWQSEAGARPSAAQAHALLAHLHATHARARTHAHAHSDAADNVDFEERWQRLKPNTIPKVDEHVAIVHAPSTSTASHFSGSEELDCTLSADVDTAVSRSSSATSDRGPHVRSESLTNLHGSLEDVRNIYLTHNETPALDCHQGNVHLEDPTDKDQDRSDASMDPWLKDIIAGSQDDVSYYKDVSDVIKNLDNILNSEKTSSSESSHQASPSRDNLSLDCKKELPLQSTLVKSPGITNFQNILDTGFAVKPEDGEAVDDEVDRDTIGTLSHSFERHSDSASQHTLENLTPDTPIKDLDVLVDKEGQIVHSEVIKIENEINNLNAVEIENKIRDTEELDEDERREEAVVNLVANVEFESDKSVERETELPKEVVDNNMPKLKELCVASMPSVSECINEQSLVRKDCQTPCDNVTEIRTDNEATKSIDDVRELIADSTPLEETEVTESLDNHKEEETTSVQETFLPVSAEDTTNSNEGADTLPSVTDDVSNTTQENDTSHIKLEDTGPESIESENNYSKDETILVSDLVDTVTDSSKDELPKQEVIKVDIEVDLEPVTPEQTPVSVQNIIDEMQDDFNETEDDFEIIKQDTELKPTHLPPEIVQNTDETTPALETVNLVRKEVIEAKNESVDNKDSEVEITPRSERYVVVDIKERSDDSTVYLDLINNTNSQIIDVSPVGNSVNEIEVKEMNSGVDESLSRNESTEYLDLPSFNVIKKTEDFLHMERMKQVDQKLVASTPIVSDESVDPLDDTVDNKESETVIMSDTKVPDAAPSATRSEQKCVPDAESPFESPSHKSHQTDTYEENSSVVLGPFENCTTELFKAKASFEPVELPREELLAFSSNFSEIYLETPSPLRDGNFLNEVPDIVPDDLQFDDLASISEPKFDVEVPSDDTEGSGSGTQKRVSPSTPPNSPGIFLASTSQQKYLIDIDLNSESAAEPDSSLRSIDLNQIELQITSKLAMAENENNLNIEYSGPLTVEGLIQEGGAMRESDAIPESYLAGNGGSVEDVREELSLNEECVKALRNELELKLPLAQVAAIEPQCEGDGEWQTALPPPPELVVSYPGALSPIQEETGQQLSAYENDTNWNPPTRTDSSESYPEPCNNSTDSVPELPCHDPSLLHTYTLQRTDAPHSTELTMSVDSLNASFHVPHKEANDLASPIDDRTYNKEDERESPCERISQVSPLLVSPTTDTSDTGTRVSTLSRTTLPTDAKISKPSETQCLSKATSIDSWCSNDTLYNVEENFDDLALDADLPADYSPTHRAGNSDSTDTLHDNDIEHSHCSTYIIHDTTEPCENFSPDSITENDNYTYTKVKTEAAAATPSGDTDLNDSTKNTQTKDLAYGTLMSAFSNCTTELASGLEDAWRQPELVRRSPAPGDVSLSPPKMNPGEECLECSSPRLTAEPRVRKMDSVEITCLRDESNRSETENQNLIVIDDSPNSEYRNMAPSVTSTPLVELAADEEPAEAVPLNLPETTADSAVNFRDFQQSAEIRPQDLSTEEEAPNQTSEALLEGCSKTLSNRDSLIVSERTPYSDVENSAPPQSSSRSSQSTESGINSEEFRQFETSVKSRPQDLSSLIDASSLLLKSERMSSELALSSTTGLHDQTSQSNSKSNDPTQSLDIIPPIITYLTESHELVDTGEPSSGFVINFDTEDETEQPHSIIVTEIPMNSTRISPHRTHDLQPNLVDFIQTHDSHESDSERPEERNVNSDQPKMNGDMYDQPESLIVIERKSPTVEVPTIGNNILTTEDEIGKTQSNDNQQSESRDLPNGSIDLAKSDAVKKIDEILNGGSEKFATVNFLNEPFEELIESSVDENDSTDDKLVIDEPSPFEETTIDMTSDLEEKVASAVEDKSLDKSTESLARSLTDLGEPVTANGVAAEGRMAAVTEDFLQNEKMYAISDCYFPLLSDIRFTGPASEMMSTSFQESPTSPTSPECEQDSKPNAAAEILKEWDSDSDSHSSNSSSGEFIWKQRGSGGSHPGSSDGRPGGPDSSPGSGASAGSRGSGASGASEGSGDSGSGSEGDEVDFVPSSWDCRATPSKSSLRSLEQVTPDSKKRVVFKRQKYHCVYEYPREVSDAPHSPAYLPDLSTYCEWDPTSAEEAELCYGQLFASPSALGVAYPMRAGIAFGADYDEDFFISSSARPFESLGIMSTTSQFFPGMHAKRALLARDPPDDAADYPPPSPLPATPSLDLTTPDSGVEDVTPGSAVDDEFKLKHELTWRPLDSGSSSESASPSSPGGGEALGGLRHTRDRLKLDLPPSPRVPSPRQARVFSFVLDKPRRTDDAPLVMSDDTPAAPALPPAEPGAPPPPEPTFSTFGKTAPKAEPEQKIVLDEVPAEEAPRLADVKGEGTVLDSGDEDSGIESSSKATLERTPNVS